MPDDDASRRFIAVEAFGARKGAARDLVLNKEAGLITKGRVLRVRAPTDSNCSGNP